MSDEKTLTQKWREFRPSKRLWLASCGAVAVVTVAAGFGSGVLVTHGTAEEMAQEAAQTARAELAASTCVARFSSGEQFASRFDQFQQASAFERQQLLQEENWVTPRGLEEPVVGAADRCADRLANMDPSQVPSAEGATENEEEA